MMKQERPRRPHVVHVAPCAAAPRELVGRPRPRVSPRTALLPGAAAALALLAAVLPVPGDWGAEFGSAHWLTRAFAAAAALALFLGLGSSYGSKAACAAASYSAGAGFLEYVCADPSDRAPAPLAVCLCCAAAVLLCVPLVRRTDPWLGLDAQPPRPGRELRRRLRLLGVLGLVGACLGGLLGAGAFLFAYERRTDDDRKPPSTEAELVPDGNRDSGAARTTVQALRP